MRVITFILIVLICVGNLLAQIPNNGFENWTEGEPENWITNNVPDFVIFASQTNDANSGSSALKLEMKSFLNLVMGGSVISGIEGAGIPISQRYQSLNGYFKFLPNANSTAFSVTIGMLKSGIVIGAGGFATFSPSNSYTQFSAPITYTDQDVPDTALIIITILDSTFSSASIGGFALVDDLSFSSPTFVENNYYSPDHFNLSQNYPNPFNPITRISWQTPVNGQQTLKIYDVLGNEAITLVDEYRPAGAYEVEFNAKDLASGIYFYKLQSGSLIQTKKMILLK